MIIRLKLNLHRALILLTMPKGTTYLIVKEILKLNKIEFLH